MGEIKCPVVQQKNLKLFTVMYEQLNGCGDAYFTTSAIVQASSREEAMVKLDLHMERLAEADPDDWQARSARPAINAYETKVIK